MRKALTSFYHRSFTWLLRSIALAGILCLFTVTVSAIEMERRKDQFENTPGYLIIPAPYNYPGIGGGMMLVAYAGNTLETSTDLVLVTFSGEAEGYFSFINEVFVVPDYVYLNLNRMHITSFGVNNYSSRGMESEKDDYTIFVGDKYIQNNAELALTLFERRLEVSVGTFNSVGRLKEIRDSEGELITKIEDPEDFNTRSNRIRTRFDLTDDFNDPRSGLRVVLTGNQQFAEEPGSPEFNVMSYDISYFIPFLKDSTWGFNLYRSDAYVTKEGDTDLEGLQLAGGIQQCSYVPDSASCEKAITEDAQNTYNSNKNGTSMFLGGTGRLRSYPQGRYQAAHTLFYGTEFRWNVNTERLDLDLYFLSDIMQALQVAFFWEQGSVTEEEADLGSIVRSSYGAGARLVTESGNVYRFDVATGDEGTEVIIMFQYPWYDSE